MASRNEFRKFLKEQTTSSNKLTIEVYEQFLDLHPGMNHVFVMVYRNDEEERGIAGNQQRIRELLGGDWKNDVAFMSDFTTNANLVLMRDDHIAVGLVLSELILDFNPEGMGMGMLVPQLSMGYFYCPYIPLMTST